MLLQMGGKGNARSLFTILVRVELIPKEMAYDDKEGLAGWLRTTWLPYTNRIPEDQREGFIAEIIEGYIDRYPLMTDGKIYVKMVRLEAEAVKNR